MGNGDSIQVSFPFPAAFATPPRNPHCLSRSRNESSEEEGRCLKTNNLVFSENEVGRCFFLLATGTYFEEVIGILSSPKKLLL